MKLSTTFVSATIAIILVLSYIVWSLRNRRQIQLESCAGLFVCGPGLVGGVLLLASMYKPSLLTLISEYELYIGLGGLSLLFTIMKGIRKVFTQEAVKTRRQLK